MILETLNLHKIIGLLLSSEYFSENLIRLVPSLEIESENFHRHSLSLIGIHQKVNVVRVREHSWICQNGIKLLMVAGKLIFTKLLPEFVCYESKKHLEENWEAR